jgi:spore coat polysaccharide biosynthesis predicted glycosyltransferase SpsG
LERRYKDDRAVERGGIRIMSVLPDMLILIDSPAFAGYGHRMRTNALRQEYARRGGQSCVVFDDVLMPRNLADKILVIDWYGYNLPDAIEKDNGIIVRIDDYQRQVDSRIDLVVNQSTHILSPYGLLDYLYSDLSRDKLVGFKYFMRRSEFDDIDVRDDNYIALIPGSSPLMSDHDALYQLCKWLGTHNCGYDIHVVKGMSPQQTADEIAGASFVICPASVSALESCSLGKPTLVMMTADNQFYLYNALLASGAAVPFTRRNLFELIGSEQERYDLSQRAKQVVPSDGVVRVADKIIELWEMKNG